MQAVGTTDSLVLWIKPRHTQRVLVHFTPQLRLDRAVEDDDDFFLNLGGATSADICALIEEAKERVHKRFGIVLEEEIRYLKNR
jgi:hypothetical protein